MNCIIHSQTPEQLSGAVNFIHLGWGYLNDEQKNEIIAEYQYKLYYFENEELEKKLK